MAAGQPELRLDLIGSWGGSAADVQIVERDGQRLAFVAVGSRLEILNATDLRSLELLGAVDLVAAVRGVAVDGDVVYCATAGEPYRFCVVDAADPSRPALAFAKQHKQPVVGAGQWPRSPDGVAIWESFAYVRDSSVGVFDLTEPWRPVHLGPAALAGDRGVEIVGDLAYVGSDHREEGLSIHQLGGDPLHPELLGRLTFPGSLRQFSVDGHIAAVVIDRDSPDPPYVQVVDVSVPSAPRLRGRIESSVSRTAPIVVAGGVLLLPDPAPPGPSSAGGASEWELSKGLRLFDIGTDPDAPRPLSAFKPRDLPVPLGVVDGVAWLASAEGLILLDISDPSDPLVIARRYRTSTDQGIAASGDDVFVSDSATGVTWLDWSDDHRPSAAAVFRTPGFDGTTASGGLQVHGGLHLADAQLAFAAGYNGLYVLDAQNPAEFLPRAALAFPPCVRSEAVEREGARLHVGTSGCGGEGWLVEFTIDYGAQTIADHGFYYIGSPPARIRSDGAGHSYAVVRTRSLVFDTRDADTPTLLAEIGVGGSDAWLEDGRRLWISQPDFRGEGLHVYDVSDPRSPELLSHIPIRFCSSVTMDDSGRLYTVGSTGSAIPGSTHSEALSVFDISDPANPRVLAQARGAQREPRLAWADGRIYEAGDYIKAYRLRCLADADGDGALTVNDYFHFLHALEIGDLMLADCDGDKLLTLFDVLCFQNAYAGGCP